MSAASLGEVHDPLRTSGPGAWFQDPSIHPLWFTVQGVKVFMMQKHRDICVQFDSIGSLEHRNLKTYT